MKKRYVVIGLLAASLFAKAQQKDSLFEKRKLRQTEVDLLFSYYTQDNDHSAVTGGVGTEELQVYSSQVSMHTYRDSSRSTSLQVGLDIISSASTDQIDFVMSSASLVDARSYAKLGFDRSVGGIGKLGFYGAFSMESDYLSWGGGMSFHKQNKDHSRTWLASVEAFFDDLRWGRLSAGKELNLIYPEELRNVTWFDFYRRNSYNLSLGLNQILNRRMTLGIYPGLALQSGLLSTPFHRVYFSDGSKKVENLPTQRVKFPIGFQLNSFVGSRTIVRLYYRFYVDSFGIHANTFMLEIPVKFGPRFTLSPFARIYAQRGTRYFNPNGEHSPSAEFYTSDYDLSDFASYRPGLALRYAPYAVKNRLTFNDMELRYSMYNRSDGLKAHIISLFIGYQLEGKQ